MLRRISLPTRRLLASTLLALTIAPAVGCGYVDRWIARRERAAVLDMRAEDAAIKDRGPLQQARDRRREARDRAWARVAKGDGPGDYSIDDATALSEAARQLDVQSTWEHPPASGHATLADLPRRHWWYLFVPPSAWSKGPLAIDQEHPGAYAALTDALEQVVGKSQPGAPALTALTADGYLELHRLATLGVFDREHRRPIAPDFAHAPNRYPVAALHDLAMLHVDHLAQALAELKAEGVAGWSSDLQHDRSDDAPPAWLAKLLANVEDINPHSKPAKLVYVRAPGEHGFEEWLVAMNAYDAHEARKWAAQWLADYAAEQAKAPHRTANEYLDLLAAQPPLDDFTMELKPASKPSEDLAAMVRPIARLVRRLEVSHLFADRAEALDTTLLLDALLAANGMPPAIIEDPTIFGGREPIDELVAEIIKGQLRFQVLVRELSARDNTSAPGVSIPAAPAAPK